MHRKVLKLLKGTKTIRTTVMMMMIETLLCIGESHHYWVERCSLNYQTQKVFKHSSSSSSSSNMAGFTATSLELDPLSPSSVLSPLTCCSNKEPFLKNEFAEALLFKPSHLNSGPMSPMPYHHPYTPTPPQLLSPSTYPSNYCLDQPAFIPGNVASSGGTNFGSPFPSMSVNVSMNMTMGYLPTDPTSLQQHQMGWPVPGCSQGSAASSSSASSTTYVSPYSSSPSSHHHHHHHHTPNHFFPQPYSATYSFAADFRPEPAISDPVRSSSWMTNSASSSILSPSSGLPPPASRSFTCSSSPSSPCNSHKRMRTRLEMLSPTEGLSLKCNLCRICGKTYARPSTLKTHLRTHSGEKPYRCVECHKSFSQAANLTAHVRTHSGEKPFGCPICARRFSQSSSVTTHMRTHSGERPYSCRLCKKAFSDSSTLTKHLRIHSGEKPYQCKLCLLRFSQSGNLNRHMRVHSGNC